jgi:hypothetical protein
MAYGEICHGIDGVRHLVQGDEQGGLQKAKRYGIASLNLGEVNLDSFVGFSGGRVRVVGWLDMQVQSR